MKTHLRFFDNQNDAMLTQLYKHSYIESAVKTNSQFVISKSDAISTIMSSLSSDICSAKVIALINQPEVI